MSRGLGKRQREIMAALEGAADHRLPIHIFCSDLGDDYEDYAHNQNEFTKVRSAIRGLEKRGLVSTYRGSDPARQIKTRVIIGNMLDGYHFENSTRAWSGTWVALSQPSEVDTSRDSSGGPS